MRGDVFAVPEYSVDEEGGDGSKLSRIAEDVGNRYEYLAIALVGFLVEEKVVCQYATDIVREAGVVKN